MPTINEAIEEFQKKRLEVYRADSDQITRDTRAAERVIKDHIGRWLFELLQNCDDAKATRVKIQIEQNAIYVADSGEGLKPSAISALCGTDFSDKTTGKIGRKGIGFKSVYEISSSPMVLTIYGDGVEFNPSKTRDWLCQNGFPDHHVPHQWIPFFISWEEAKERFTNLDYFNDYKTIVVLPINSNSKENVEQLLQEWSPFSLFAFRNVREIKTNLFEIFVKSDGDIWEIEDSRQETPTRWKGAKWNEIVPQGIAETLNEDERRFIEKDGVSFLVAAPQDKKYVGPTQEYLPVFVFYPTLQTGPVRLLLHAEFLVKSDRTAILPIESTPFNEWVAEKLAIHVCNFVQKAYSSEKPSSHLALLVPFDERSSHPLAPGLWEFIASKVKEKLRIGNSGGKARLPISEARFISVSVRPGLARQILQKTDLRNRLPHLSFDEDKQAQKVLRELNCEAITDTDLLALIKNEATEKIEDHEWLWQCWKWLACWLDEKPWGDERNKRIEKIRELPIIPVKGLVCKSSKLEGKIVTWHENEQPQKLPAWLPLAFLDEWFRDRIQSEEDESRIEKLLQELSISEPDENVIQHAVSKAISNFWKKRIGNPSRFLSFIVKQDWYETNDKAGNLKQCPIPIRMGKTKSIVWEKANTAYFGEEWGNDLLAQVYERRQDVSWVIPLDSEPKEIQREVLLWLGVLDCPRFIIDKGKKSRWKLPEECKDWKDYLGQERDTDGRTVYEVDSITRLDKIEPGSLRPKQTFALMQLLTKHWSAYYKSHSRVDVSGRRSREWKDRHWEAFSLWWYEVRTKLIPPLTNRIFPVPLEKCWLPDKRAERAIGELLPVIDTTVFGENEPAVREWLEDEVGIRTRIEQLTPAEWREILTQRISHIVPVQRAAQKEPLRNKVTRWYEACLDTAKDDDNFSENCFANCPVLCRRVNQWSYVANEEPRFVEDDREFATAFSDAAWLISIPSRLKSAVLKFMGIPSLSDSVEVTPHIPNRKEEIPEELKQVLEATLPYVYAMRCSQSKDFRDNSPVEREHLKSIKCYSATDLRSDAVLNGIQKVIDNAYVILEGEIFLREDCCSELFLAKALAEFVGVKSDADFYENLLRCQNDQERKDKLRSKELTEVDIQRVREYNEVEEEPTPVALPPQELGASIPPEEPEKSFVKPSQPQSPPSPESQPVSPEMTQQGLDNSPDLERTVFNLVDAEDVRYEVVTELPISVNPNGHSSYAGGAGTSPAESLTYEQKRKIEQSGRAIARRELEKMGYDVEEMPFKNPGYDIKATKQGCKELRIEVKGHLRKQTVVDLTFREYEEYQAGSSSCEYVWQLWNIENLEAGKDTPTIMKFSEIPEEALNTRTFRVDIRKCVSAH